MESFYRIKQALISAPIIKPPDWKLPFEIMCDASDYAVGTILGQRKDKALHAIYYSSKTLDGAQVNYATTEKELLVVVNALDKFQTYLVGSKVIVHTDYSLLKYLLLRRKQNQGLFVGFCYSRNLTQKSKIKRVLGMWLQTIFHDYSLHPMLL